MSRSRTRSFVATTIATTATTALVLTGLSPATATSTVSDPIASGLAGPLQIDVGHKGQVYVGQSFAGILTKVRPNGSTKDLAFEPGSVTGVASRGYDVAYTFAGGDETSPVALLKMRKANGKIRTIADLQAYEAKRNPDARRVYGFLGLTDECREQVPPEVGGDTYTGIVESNPYAVANGPHGGWYVADAAANAVLYVSPQGKITTVSVPKPQRLRVTPDIAEGLGLPDCTLGKQYAFEPVPTDVEVTGSGHLIVSLLPGGPESPVLGPRGSVLRINPWTGDRTKLASGFFAATNVAVGPHGKVYVAELFGNQISRVHNGQVAPVVSVPSPAGVEYRNGKLYASIDVFGAGEIVTITP